MQKAKRQGDDPEKDDEQPETLLQAARETRQGQLKYRPRGDPSSRYKPRQTGPGRVAPQAGIQHEGSGSGGEHNDIPQQKMSTVVKGARVAPAAWVTGRECERHI
jgi:hypothetical protein